MRRRFPLMLRLTMALVLTLVIPLVAMTGLSHYMQGSIRQDMEDRVEATLDMAINMEVNLLDDGAADMRAAALAIAADPGAAGALGQAAGGAGPFDLTRFQGVFPRADILLLVDRAGVVRARLTSDQTGDQVLLDGLVEHAITTGEPQAHPALISAAELSAEAAAIRQMVEIPILQAGGENGQLVVGGKVDRALALTGVAPVHGVSGAVIGAVIAADILNHDFRIVDEVQNWASAGTPLRATIAVGGVRVTTNVRLRDPEGREFQERALGTRYSDAVMQSLETAGIHRGRADVVGQWQRTIYRNITDFRGRAIAAPYVGIPESHFATISTKLTRSLRLVVTIGIVPVLVTLLGALWYLRRTVVLRLRRLTGQVATEPPGPEAGGLAGFGNDEIGDAALEIMALRSRWAGAADSLRAAAGRLTKTMEPLPLLADARPAAIPGVPSATEVRTGAGSALEHLHKLSEAIRAISDGVRSEERSIHYVGRVAAEIASGLAESRGTVESAMSDVGDLAASARAALRQAGEFAAGLAVLRQSLAGRPGQPALDLLHDPSDLLTSLAALSERVAGEVRSLVLIIQENQARLAFIQEEMTRVSAVVGTTATSTQAATRAAGEAIGWMEGMTTSAVSVADEVLAARAGLEAAAAANRHLLEWCGQVQDMTDQVLRTVGELP
ncbi:MAG: putative methyl-accepting chemotaxis protein [Symbiobacteriaceae bacterium]|jgi:methyl-accepting chemotaxis protein|nr:putative methyl-accepting chemotaxis protein [Symbiobacteriaceae bacterium]